MKKKKTLIRLFSREEERPVSWRLRELIQLIVIFNVFFFFFSLGNNKSEERIFSLQVTNKTT